MILLKKAFKKYYYTLLNPCIMNLLVILLSIAAGNTEVNYVSLDTIELIFLSSLPQDQIHWENNVCEGKMPKWKNIEYKWKISLSLNACCRPELPPFGLQVWALSKAPGLRSLPTNQSARIERWVLWWTIKFVRGKFESTTATFRCVNMWQFCSAWGHQKINTYFWVGVHAGNYLQVDVKNTTSSSILRDVRIDYLSKR